MNTVKNGINITDNLGNILTRLLATADPTLFTATLNNDALQFSYVDGSVLSISSYKIEAFGANQADHTLIQLGLQVFETADNSVTINNGKIVLLNKKTSSQVTISPQGVDTSKVKP